MRRWRKEANRRKFLPVSSPGAERLLEVPEDLDRFKDMAIRVQYLVEGDDLVLKQILRKNGIFLLKSVDIQAEHCIRKLGRCQGEPSCSWERKVIEQETKGLEAANFV
ncbi:Os01g0594650 [Oryza sativa Japonica Group]|uniref:Os01g0594650 protein n=1 Tax=Oryza sativa subsp. japonica TaxID=39947 RepID=A0A0P0V4S8_ORYSJ|nr:hypothetical protein EE612_003841 [Oryza sativa]BAS72974.1 Os01g0594650 [Oryza sativa Japonica Group]